jgi:hypothetical protein
VTGIHELFSELDGYEQYQQDLFCWLLRKQCERREMHREWMRFWRKTRTAEQRKAANVSRRTYWRAYRRRKRQEQPEAVARDREAARIRAAASRARRRGARAA